MCVIVVTLWKEREGLYRIFTRVVYGGPSVSVVASASSSVVVVVVRPVRKRAIVPVPVPRDPPRRVRRAEALHRLLLFALPLRLAHVHAHAVAREVLRMHCVSQYSTTRA